MGEEAEIETAASGAGKLAPTVHRDISVAACEIDFQLGRGRRCLKRQFTGVLGGVVVGIDKDSPAATPLCIGVGRGAAIATGDLFEDDLSTALDGF